MTQTRRMQVLRAVVEDYIRSQEPVGSSALIARHNLKVSSATIRKDMAALEDEGFLTQPHTSAGRVPTERGYRYFVDSLSELVPLTEPQREAIRTLLDGSVNLQDALQRSARLLARFTGQVAVVAAGAVEGAIVASGGHRRLVDLTARRCGDRHRPCGPAYPHRAAPARRAASAGILRRSQRPLQYADTAARGAHNPRDARR